MKNIKCRNCFFYRNEWCEKIVDSPDPEEARDCDYFREMTNADKIRSMSDEELAKAIFNWFFMKEHCDMCVPEMRTPKKCNGRCTSGILRWLQQPAEEDDHDERKENENV